MPRPQMLTWNKALPRQELPMETDAMANSQDLINRAIVMHFLREGQFDVASTFLRESEQKAAPSNMTPSLVDLDGDDDMDRDDNEKNGGMRNEIPLSFHSLQDKFANMYGILSELKNHNLVPAIEWASSNSELLEAKGSSIEFELVKLQYIWLFKGPAVNGLPDDESNGQNGAYQYGRRHFARFRSRHLKEILQLCGALAFRSNIEQSPYAKLFRIDSAFEDVALCFTRDFCSLLGLSTESPLYVAVTAGAIALPPRIKYTNYLRMRRMEWTTTDELAYETPLPSSMIYHPIFVCPVSKAQTTEQNPPMMLPCGHVISRESLTNITRGIKFKCPYCPQEGYMRDAIRITL